MGSEYHYFDYAATAPLCAEAAEALKPFLASGAEGIEAQANANSLHTVGRNAFRLMEDARRRVAKALGAKRPDEIIFTSGATEADNSALIGMARSIEESLRMAGQGALTPHLVVSSIEHEAVLQPALFLRSQGWDLTVLDPDKQGFITPEALDRALRPETKLVSVMVANSEIGSIQPIAELARVAHQAGALFHTDAVQALGKIPVSLQGLGVDAASFSAHKIGGPKGVGALYLKARTPFTCFMLGGGQEGAKRSGTQNVPGVCAFAAAAQAAVERQPSERQRLSCLRDRLYGRLSEMDGVRVTVPACGSDEYLPNIVHAMVDGLESETIVLRMDKAGFAVSGGSACSSGSLEPSHVLTAMGIEKDLARGAVRFSMGSYTTEEEVDLLIDAFKECIE